ncbi:hypothetical protein O3P69_010879 [Scylla paramamosain]|uniref:Uncharacterized protein n=1 Tax=Scylla paramamosain TaxID=85552 RepID=A0AAW0TGY4_SCYPA
MTFDAWHSALPSLTPSLLNSVCHMTSDARHSFLSHSLLPRHDEGAKCLGMGGWGGVWVLDVGYRSVGWCRVKRAKVVALAAAVVVVVVVVPPRGLVRVASVAVVVVVSGAGAADHCLLRDRPCVLYFTAPRSALKESGRIRASGTTEGKRRGLGSVGVSEIQIQHDRPSLGTEPRREETK